MEQNHGIPSSVRCHWRMRSPEEGALPSKMACCVLRRASSAPARLSDDVFHTAEARGLERLVSMETFCSFAGIPSRRETAPVLSVCTHTNTSAHTLFSATPASYISKKCKVTERGNWSLKNKDTIGERFAGNRLFFIRHLKALDHAFSWG